jgi:hypothetical protein
MLWVTELLCPLGPEAVYTLVRLLEYDPAELLWVLFGMVLVLVGCLELQWVGELIRASLEDLWPLQ